MHILEVGFDWEGAMEYSTFSEESMEYSTENTKRKRKDRKEEGEKGWATDKNRAHNRKGHGRGASSEGMYIAQGHPHVCLTWSWPKV